MILTCVLASVLDEPFLNRDALTIAMIRGRDVAVRLGAAKDEADDALRRVLAYSDARRNSFMG